MTLTPWYRRPLIKRIDIQRGALYVGVFSVLLAVLTFATATFDLYCYAMTAPGSVHYGFFAFSYEFVYIGNKHVRNLLIAFASLSLLLAVGVAVTAALQIAGVRSERERLLLPWLFVFAVYVLVRLLALICFAIVNDLVFVYNLLTVLFWSVCVPASCYGWLVVYSLQLQLAALSRLEDVAQVRSTYDRLRHHHPRSIAHHALPEIFETPTKERDDCATTVTTPIEMMAGPSSCSASILTNTDQLSIVSTATATMPIEQVVYERYLGNI